MTTIQTAAVSTAPAAASRPSGKLWDECCRFETVFLGLLMKGLRETVPATDGAFGESQAQQMVRGMFDERLVDEMGRRGVAGIAAMLHRQLEQKPTARLDAKG